MAGATIGLYVTRGLQLLFAVIVLGVAASIIVRKTAFHPPILEGQLEIECRAACLPASATPAQRDSDVQQHDADLLKDYVCDTYHPYCSIFKRFSTSVEYATFTGAFGMFDAIVGLVAAFLSAIPWVVPLALDALAAIFFLAGGINSAVIVGGNGDCSGYSLCTKYEASIAFMFLGFFASLACMVLVFLQKRSA